MLYRCHEGVMEISPPLPGFLITAGYLSWTCRLLFFGNDPQKSQNLMMSVFRSNTLSLLQSVRNTFLGAQISKLLSGGMPPDPLETCTFDTCKLHLWCKFFFFILCLLQSFCHLLKTLLTTKISKLLPEGMPPDPPSNLHFGRLQVARTVQVYFPSLPTPKVLPPT